MLLTVLSFWWMFAGCELEGPMILLRFLPVMWVLVVLNLLAAVSLPGKSPKKASVLPIIIKRTAAICGASISSSSCR